MNTANKLTMARVVMIPIFLLVFYLVIPPYRNYIALVIFILASVTDFIDGYVARHYNQITDFGKFMDPLADKLLVVSAMLWFVESGMMPAWAVLIVVAIAGIAGYTMPSQEVAGALRIWRFLLALLASAAGLFGVVAGLSALVIHLAGIESFGVSYLTPFASNAGEQVEGHAVFRQPLPQVKQRPAALKTRNRRNQK